MEPKLLAFFRINNTETVQDITWLREQGYIQVIGSVSLVLMEPEKHGLHESTRVQVEIKPDV